MYFGGIRMMVVDYEKQKQDALIYQWNRQMDFNGWYDDVYIISNKDSGHHTTSQLWDLFEKYEEEKD